MPRPSRARFLRELETHVDGAYSFARWLTGGSDEAEDLVHDALARA
ncbi:MAG: RNA polymerase subunit sigma, partial [Candidatus Tectomicrobia bacterium]|nr:RNA polymerase subunit sigma [Candidatus Tectomicrobia bacterium]